jgi:hypoxanthine phosphoribosyltransferase
MIATIFSPSAAGSVERLDPLIDEHRILARVAELAAEIDADYRDKPLHLVAVLKGAVIFAADLMRQIATPFTVDFVSASSYGAGTVSAGTVALGGIDRLDLSGRHVLVVEDILDTGATSNAVLGALLQRGPESAYFCTLLRKPKARARALPARYTGFDIGDDFVVGYGLDYAERYRNLRAIYRLVLAG